MKVITLKCNVIFYFRKYGHYLHLTEKQSQLSQSRTRAEDIHFRVDERCKGKKRPDEHRVDEMSNIQ